MLRIMIADDHRLVRAGLRNLLATDPDLQVVAELPDGQAVLQALLEDPSGYDLLILDLSMPYGDIDLIRKARSKAPSLAVLVLSMHNEGQVINRVLQAGATGYVTKDCDAETLFFAIKRVASGEKFIDPEILDSVLQASESLEQTFGKLSPREKEVFDMLIKGKSVSQIAEMLEISIKTASTHKANLLSKLSLGNTADLVKFAIHNKLVN